MQFPSGTIVAEYLDDEDDRLTWLDDRRAGIGGSDIAAIMGMSAFNGPLDVYYSKVEEVSDNEEAMTEPMEWGVRLESVILKHFTDLFAVNYDDNKRLIRSDLTPILLHSPDAIELDEDGFPIGGIEIKNIRSDKAWTEPYGMPEYYYAQVQHGLYVTGLDKWTIVALVSGNKMIYRTVYPDHDFQDMMVKAANNFWLEYVISHNPPPVDGSEPTSKVLQTRWTSVEEAKEIPYDVYHDLLNVRDEIKEMEKHAELLEQQIKEVMADAQDGTVDGVRVVSWKTSTRNTMDTTRLRKEMPEIAEQYNKETPVRVFRVLS